MTKRMSDWDWEAHIYNRLEAELKRDLAEAQSLGFDPFKEKVDGKTLLNMCAQVDWATACAWIGPQSDLTALDPEGDTPLMAALKTGSGSAARELARLETAMGFDEDGNNPLHVAIALGALVVASILSPKADLSVRGENGDTALMMALREEEEALALTLIALTHPEALSERDAHGETVLSLAIKMDLPKAALALAKLGHEEVVSIKDGHGMTPLSLSLASSMDEVSLVLAQKADPNARDADGDDGFACALGWDFDPAAEILANRIDPSSKDSSGRDALAVAWDEDRFDLSKIIAAQPGLDVQSGVDEGESHLHRAFQLRDFETAALLLGSMDQDLIARACESELDTGRQEAMKWAMDAKSKGESVKGSMLAVASGFHPQSQAERVSIVSWLSKVFR